MNWWNIPQHPHAAAGLLGILIAAWLLGEWWLARKVKRNSLFVEKPSSDCDRATSQESQQQWYMTARDHRRSSRFQ